MPRYTTAYSGFLQRLPEIEALNCLAKQHTIRLGEKNDAATVKALCRANIVLMSSHLEGYVEELAEVILQRIFQHALAKGKLAPRFLYYFSKDLLDELYETRNPDKIACKVKKLFQRDIDIWSDDDTFRDELPSGRFISEFSNPSVKKITHFVARFGYSNYRYDLGHLLKANCQPCINMVDNVIDQRNKIAHGDAVVTSTPNDVADMLRLVRLFCRASDDVIGRWFKSAGCVIR
jgi:hypothetical protein